jgi:glyoxylase-like metal-dependent hydrolase (beta-lactamase superfamily II)
MMNMIVLRNRAVRMWLLLVALTLVACGGVPAPKPSLTQQRPLEGLLEVTAYANSDPYVALATMQQLSSSHRDWQGYEYFGRLAREQPNRRAFFTSLQAVMQARVASEVPLLKRVAWVEDAMAKLDAGAAADPRLGRLARGLVFAELPERFHAAKIAVEDLEACIAARGELPEDLDRGIYRALATAYQKVGDPSRSREMMARSGYASLDGRAPRVVGNLSVDGVHGFRFGEKRLVREAEGVYVAEGYDFANLAFIVGASSVVAIDAGTTEPSARDAVAALRAVTKAPIKYIILTHGHWDHVGGLPALREPGSTVIAQAGFAKELERSRRYHPPFQYFFGNAPVALDVTPDKLVAAPETLSLGDIELELIPAKSGETDDALFIHDKRHDILFVGDALMPYIGAPFVAEGSPEGYLGAIDQMLELHPRRIVHGHPPLTRLYKIEALPGLRVALRALYDRSLEAARAARPLADVLHDNFIPESLRDAPQAALPYLVVRDTFVQRLYAEHAGYWQSDGEGIESFTHDEWARVLDALGGNTDSAFARTADDLIGRGDAALALRVAELGLARHPASAALQQSRVQALTMLREINSASNPFRFIVYSEWARDGLGPVSPR